MRPLRLLPVVLMLLPGCARETTDASALESVAEHPAVVDIEELPSPAGPGSGEPQLTIAPDGRTFLSWLEPVATNSKRYRFRYAERQSRSWVDRGTIAESETFFVNWADVPSVAALADGRLAAHWLERRGAGKYAYDVRVSISDASGRTWSAPVIPHRDGTESEHGFASLFSRPGGGLGLVWLDGRDFASHHPSEGGEMKGEMSIRAAAISPEGQLTDEKLIDARVCDCCPTAAVRTARGVLVAYRDRSAGEIRDISLARYENGAWTESYRARADDWQIPGCPVNGPALSADGMKAALAWFAAPENRARVMVALSNDGGVTFGTPVRVDDGEPLGRVDVELLEGESALVSWIEFGGGNSEFRLRSVTPRGRGAAIRIASVTSDRSSGYPRMVRSGGDLVFAWTAGGPTTHVKTAVGRIGGSGQPSRTPRPGRSVKPRALPRPPAPSG